MPTFDLEQAIESLAQRCHDLWMRHRIAILACTAINLAAIAALLLLQMQGTPRFAESQLFLGLETEEPTEAKPATPQTNEKLWSQEVHPSQVRNIAVDATIPDPLNAGLADEKQIDAQALYEEAARVRQQLHESRSYPTETYGDADIPNLPPTAPAPPDELYKGPSVLSYHLEGRKPRRLVVPSYQCEAGGGIVVDIQVAPTGSVLKAQVNAALSSSDACLQQAALTAALRSQFSISTEAPNPQAGSISYLFVPQR